MDDETLLATRRTLHGVAELLIAGPQYRAHGTIRLRCRPGGFAGAALDVGVSGTDFVWPGGRAELTGTYGELATRAGIDAGPPADLYKDLSGLTLDDRLDLDAGAATLILDWLVTGDAALRAFAPAETPVLWPEHFDLGIVAGEVNYGVSPGDSAHPRPYAYVGPWTPRTGPFWNASFGALRSIDDLPDVSAITNFFVEGRAELE